jgi:DNA-binding CsgD family transcriptional regulator
MTTASLTPREQQVCDLICSGLTVKQAARELGISYYTVDQHKQSIYLKLGVNKISQLVGKVVNAASA